MARKARYTPAVDELSAQTAGDLMPAQVSLLVDVDAFHHALMSGWGGPAYWCGCKVSGGASSTFFVRVPAGCQDVDVFLLVSGDGEALVTSTSDVTGTELHWTQQGTVGLPQALVVATSGTNTGAAAADGAALRVRAALAWTWTDETVTVAVTGTGATVWGVGIRPVHPNQ